VTIFGVALLAVLSSGLPCWAVTDDPWLSLGTAPLVFALFATVSAILATLFGLPLLAIFVPAILAANVAALWALFTREPPSLAGSQPLTGAVLAAVTAYGLLPLKAPLLDWDTRTHWLGPAHWYLGGGSYVRYAITNPAFHHRSYPPLIAASAGTTWLLQGHVDLRSGQVLVAVLNYGAVLLIGLGVTRLFPKMGALPPLGAAMLVLSVFGIAGQFATDGYADLLWASCATVAVLYLLLAPANRVNIAIGSLAICVAGLTKVEGMVVAVALIGFGCWRHRKHFIEAWPVVAAAPVVLLWPVYVRLLGVPTDLHPEDVHAFINGHDAVWRRVIPTSDSMLHATGGILVVAALCTVIGTNVALQERERLRIGSSDWAWGTVGVAALAIASAYIVSSDELGLHLRSSVGRVTIVLRILLLTDVVIWALCGVRALAALSNWARGKSPVQAGPDVLRRRVLDRAMVVALGRPPTHRLPLPEGFGDLRPTREDEPVGR
jgi:hypothetical protein